MVLVEEETVALGIVGPFGKDELEGALHTSLNEDIGERSAQWSLSENGESTYALSCSTSVDSPEQLSPRSLANLANAIADEMAETPRIFLWIHRVARYRQACRTANWANMNLVPYCLFKLVLFPQKQTLASTSEQNMWLRMQLCLSVCCKGYFPPMGQEVSWRLLDNFRSVLGPSISGHYVGMQYSPEDVLKELSISITLGSCDGTETDNPLDKSMARDWAHEMTSEIEQDEVFRCKTVERMVMRHIFSNDIAVSSPYYTGPSSRIKSESVSWGGGSHVLHPPLSYQSAEDCAYSNVIGKTILVVADIETVFASVDDCGWGLPVGDCGIVLDFNEHWLSGQVSGVRALRASDGMSAVIGAVCEYSRGNGSDTEHSAVLAAHILRSTVQHLQVRKVIVANTESVRFCWRE